MQITLSQDQLEKLMHLAYLGNWLVNSYRGDRRLEEYDKLAETILSFAPSAGLQDRVEFDEFEGSYYPARKLEDEVGKFWEEYDEDVFWNMLVDGLAERDYIREHGEENLEAIDLDDYNKRLEPFLRKYEKEIDEHGLDRLEVLLPS
ncbi:MAG TPA: hypothetical protein VMW46_03735 [Candidatus Desulfaltia sp.]|nr:hypothetical protein [Candidatus Desulfaltia sp.]